MVYSETEKRTRELGRVLSFLGYRTLKDWLEGPIDFILKWAQKENEEVIRVSPESELIIELGNIYIFPKFETWRDDFSSLPKKIISNGQVFQIKKAGSKPQKISSIEANRIYNNPYVALYNEGTVEEYLEE